ncbi:hypothetical protein DsansV1_C03g0035311 [Dioscorea sansibarensis]
MSPGRSDWGSGGIYGRRRRSVTVASYRSLPRSIPCSLLFNLFKFFSAIKAPGVKLGLQLYYRKVPAIADRSKFNRLDQSS